MHIVRFTLVTTSRRPLDESNQGLHNNYVSSNIYVHSHRHNITAGTKLFCKKKSPLKSQPCRLQCLYCAYPASYPFYWPLLTNSIFDPQRKILVMKNHATFCHVLQNASEYLTSNTLVNLTHGNYFVSEDIGARITNVHNLTLIGSNMGSTVVNCSKQFRIV